MRHMLEPHQEFTNRILTCVYIDARKMRSKYCTITLLIGALKLANAIPMCPTHMTSSDIKIDGQQNLDQSISHLTSVPYEQSRCVALEILNRENYSYRINLVELLKIKSNFVIIGLSPQQVILDCTDASNNTDNPLSGLEYVGFYRIAFCDCKIPLWVENVANVDIKEVTFRWVMQLTIYTDTVAYTYMHVYNNYTM